MRVQLDRLHGNLMKRARFQVFARASVAILFLPLTATDSLAQGFGGSHPETLKKVEQSLQSKQSKAKKADQSTSQKAQPKQPPSKLPETKKAIQTPSQKAQTEKERAANQQKMQDASAAEKKMHEETLRRTMKGLMENFPRR